MQRLRQIRNEEFAPFWPTATRPNPATLSYSASFRRELGAPSLRLRVRQQPSAVQVVHDVRLRIDGGLARLRVTAELTAPRNDLSLAEWELQGPQPLTISTVSGADVRSWSQSGNRLLVWLEKTSGGAKIDITGWLPLAHPREGPRLELPCLRLVGSQTQQTTVYVSAGTGSSVTPAGLRNLLPVSGQQASDPERAFTSRQATYGGAFNVRPATTSAEARILTFVEVRDRQVAFTTTIDYHIQRAARLRNIQFRLRDWAGEDVKLEAARVVQRRERRRSFDDRTWTLELQPSFREPFHSAWGMAAGPSSRLWRHDGVTGSYRLTLSGSMSLDEAAGGLSAPQVSIADAARVEYWLVVAGTELGVEGASGLTAVQSFDRPLAAWPRELAQLRRTGGQVWQTAANDWSLRLVPRDRVSDSAPLQVFLAEHAALVADNQHWTHEAVYWLRHEAHTDLNLTFPTSARVVAVSLDGVDSPPLQPDPDRLWLPLPGRAGVRCVRLKWVYDSPEPLERPNLEALRVEGAEEGPCLWTVHQPPSFYAGGPASGLKPGLARAAWADLQRAEAQLTISRRLVELAQGNSAVSGSLRSAQRRFADLCSQVEQTLNATRESSGESGPDGVSLRDWLQLLRKQNSELAVRYEFDDLRADAERPPRAGAGTEPHLGSRTNATVGQSGTPRGGVPLYGLTGRRRRWAETTTDC